MKHWLQINYPQPIMGYGHGVIDKYNPAPEGAQLFETEKELNAAIAEIDDATLVKLPEATSESVQAGFEAMERLSRVPDLEMLKDKYTTAQLKKFASKRKLPGRSKMNETQLIISLIADGEEL